MTLRMEQVAAQLSGTLEHYAARLQQMQSGLEAARTAMDRWQADPAAGDIAIGQAMSESRQPYALSFEEPPAFTAPAPAFAPVTVVAADGSTIEPDRFAAAPIYVLNIGWAVLPYGLPGDPVLAAKASAGPQPPAPGVDPDCSAGGLNLLRDVRELEQTAALALERLPNGPVAALLDGTLLPWDLDSPQLDLLFRAELQQRTLAAFESLRVTPEDLALGAYISSSRASDVVTSLRALAPGAAEHWPASDGQFFAARLQEGERTAVFRAASQRQERIETLFRDHPVCFFYLRLGGDVARVELPQWAATPARINRLHATIVDQCRRSGGYPRALQEAHEQAVINGADRLQFSRLLESAARTQGLRTSSNNKQMSKRRRAV